MTSWIFIANAKAFERIKCFPILDFIFSLNKRLSLPFHRRKTSGHRSQVTCPRSYHTLARAQLVPRSVRLQTLGPTVFDFISVHSSCCPLCQPPPPLCTILWAPWWQGPYLFHQHIHRAGHKVGHSAWHTVGLHTCVLDERPLPYIMTCIPMWSLKTHSDSGGDSAGSLWRAPNGLYEVDHHIT